MFSTKLQEFKIILASGSPRRQQFFKDLGLDFELRLREIEEVYPEHLKADEITDYLAELKGKAFDGTLAIDELLITSDTIVWHKNQALGKPKDAEDAFLMLKKLSNSTHQVITSVSFKTTEKVTTLHDYTEVTFCELTDEMIRYYIKNCKPFDKAGSYGIQDWIGLVGVTSISGSYTNVMGLPTHLVFEFFKTFK
ncbi:Maf family nucleotide pyrophosphatase [Flavobacterium tegetincola]|uniref:Maf family nucleotide pyrophosphatase n=1 Tax=Flavobacterium tegetincola TaxID=150172 RepID=UPI0003FBD73B|nr:Maf family nucleotide pyrophosphatase [Flavobacterium tegetincola]